jgi:U3 small nucleolar RNA-associated protein 12
VSGEVTVLACSPDKTTIAAGYSNGEVRIFNYITKALVSSQRGHRSAVTSLAYEDGGVLLASGGADSDIIVWDLVAGVGLCRLRGHRDSVTGVGFLQRGHQRLLVSGSKDTLLKVMFNYEIKPAV